MTRKLSHGFTGYSAIDDVLSRPAVRILRMLRHFDELDCYDLFELLELPRYGSKRRKLIQDDSKRVRDTYTTALKRLHDDGLVQRISTRGHYNAYRVTLAGRQWLARELAPDTVVIVDEYAKQSA